jgi:Zn-dependent peptidase ImmA (M78 family)
VTAILDRLLRLVLSAIDTGAPWAKQPTALRLACELCASPGPAASTVATAFRVLDKPLKNLGDVRLVRRTADACVTAAQATPATEEARRGEAQALICGVSWAKQRMGRLEEARGDAQRSKEIGEHLPWPRNTAFCSKCIGRLLRLEGAAKPPGPERDKLLRESVDELRSAIAQFEKLDETTEAERQAEMGASYSLLGRTFLEIGDGRASLAAIERAKGLVGEGKKKDVADLWILQGEYEARWGAPGFARVAFGHALDVTNDPAFEVAEMRARAFEQRSGVAESAKAALEDLAQAGALFAKLGDSDGAARAEFAAMRLEGRVPPALATALTGQTNAVAVRAVRFAEAERGERGSAIAYRDAVPDRVAHNWVTEARRQAVIADGESSHVAAPARDSGQLPATPRPAPVSRAKRPKEPLASVCKRLIPRARDAAQAARLLAAELTGANPEPPIRLERIAKALGIERIQAVEIARNGELRRDDDGVLSIVYSKDLGSGRQRFTIAHELGHAVLTVRGEAEVSEGRDLEQFCDTFASSLLMPKACLPKLPSPVTVESLRDVARRFEVSLPAAAMRLQRAYGGFRAFGVENDRVTWTAGDVSRGAVSLLPDTVREVVATALGGAGSAAEIIAFGGRWAVSTRWDGERRLAVVLSPRDPKVRKRTYG